MKKDERPKRKPGRPRKHPEEKSRPSKRSNERGNVEAHRGEQPVQEVETAVCQRVISGKLYSGLFLGDVKATAGILGCSEESIRRSNVTGEPVATDYGYYIFSIVKGERKEVADSMQ